MILSVNNKRKGNNQRLSCARDFPDFPGFLGLGFLLAWSGLGAALALLVLRGGIGEGDIMMGAGAGVPGSEAVSDSGETTGRKGEGALTMVLVAMLVASLKPESLVSSMISSGRGGAGGRMRVCAARTSSSVALRWAGGLDGGYGTGFLDLEPALV